MEKFKSFMNFALLEAKKAIEKNEIPVGAVIVKNNNIIAKAYNQNIELKDPTAHAEIMAIRKACKLLGKQRLSGCEIYVTLEPCAMCASAIAAARIDNLYYMISDEKYGGVENGARIFTQKNCHHKINIYNDIGDGDKYKLLLQKFFQDKR
jgi:tRNA(Arg) A34 adenosine deaminase TadA